MYIPKLVTFLLGFNKVECNGGSGTLKFSSISLSNPFDVLGHPFVICSSLCLLSHSNNDSDSPRISSPPVKEKYHSILACFHEENTENIIITLNIIGISICVNVKLWKHRFSFFILSWQQFNIIFV